jgi:hypothetical protein
LTFGGGGHADRLGWNKKGEDQLSTREKIEECRWEGAELTLPILLGESMKLPPAPTAKATLPPPLEMTVIVIDPSPTLNDAGPWRMIELAAALVDPAGHDPKAFIGTRILPATVEGGPVVSDLPPTPVAAACFDDWARGLAGGRERPERLDESFEEGLDGITLGLGRAEEEEGLGRREVACTEEDAEVEEEDEVEELKRDGARAAFGWGGAARWVKAGRVEEVKGIGGALARGADAGRTRVVWRDIEEGGTRDVSVNMGAGAEICSERGVGWGIGSEEAAEVERRTEDGTGRREVEATREDVEGVGGTTSLIDEAEIDWEEGSSRRVAATLVVERLDVFLTDDGAAFFSLLGVPNTAAPSRSRTSFSRSLSDIPKSAEELLFSDTFARGVSQAEVVEAVFLRNLLSGRCFEGCSSSRRKEGKAERGGGVEAAKEVVAFAEAEGVSCVVGGVRFDNRCGEEMGEKGQR